MKKKIIILGILLGVLLLTFMLSGCVEKDESKIIFSDDINIELQEDIEEAILGADVEISYGTTYPFNSAVTVNISITYLDSTHFVVVYEDDGGDDYGCAKIGVISNDDTITSCAATSSFCNAVL